MKVCGFSFIRNAVKFDYPIVEAIRSILPVCDAVIVAVGNSDDGTLQLIRSIDPKIQVLETTWDENLRRGGEAFAVETDKAFQAIPREFDWAFYIQGDEVVHEKYLPVIRQAMADNLDDTRVEGLLFNYLHFFGSYDFIGQKYSWYRREIRVVRNRKDIFSYRDAQGFRKKPNAKLRVRLIDAYIYHYGWTRDPDALQKKVESSVRYYHDDSWLKKFFTREDTYEYSEKSEPIGPFEGTHPAVMKERILRKNWKFEPDLSLRYGSAKDRVKRVIGNLSGWYPGEYRNYKLLR
jgi:glycosyltransferase involved in cell wall biosynthesis